MVFWAASDLNDQSIAAMPISLVSLIWRPFEYGVTQLTWQSREGVQQSFAPLWPQSFGKTHRVNPGLRAPAISSPTARTQRRSFARPCCFPIGPAHTNSRACCCHGCSPRESHFLPTVTPTALQYQQQHCSCSARAQRGDAMRLQMMKLMTYDRILSIGNMFLFGRPCGGSVGTHHRDLFGRPFGGSAGARALSPYSADHSVGPYGIESPYSADHSVGPHGSCNLKHRREIMIRSCMAFDSGKEGGQLLIGLGLNIVSLAWLFLVGAWRSKVQSRTSLGSNEPACLLV